jgi:large subunit ribosomal protein L15
MIMSKRPSKRNRKFLGSRSHGKGNAKNKRGKGGKGGWGRAGMHKHRFSYVTAYEREWMKKGGKFGFTNPNKKEVPALNLWNIEQMASSGKLKEEGGMKTLVFEGKVLGTGQLSAPVFVKAWSASKKAIERIKAAGGMFEPIKNESTQAKDGENKE